MKKINPLCDFLITLLASLTFFSAFSAPTQAEEDQASTNAQANSTNPIRLHRPTPKQQFNWLAQMADNGRVEWLEGEKIFFSLYAQERSGQAKGAVILISPAGQYAGWSKRLANLHQYLPDYGWNSLAITLPEAVKITPIAADANNHTREANAPGDDEETSDEQVVGEPFDTAAAPKTNAEPDKLKNTHLQTAMDFLSKEGQFNIVLITSGAGALYAAQYLNQANLSAASVQALVLIDAVNETMGIEEKLPALLGNLSLPIFDLYDGFNSNQTIFANQRRQKLKALPPARYQQLQIPTTVKADEPQHDYGSRRIRGWLERYVSGHERDRR